MKKNKNQGWIKYSVGLAIFIAVIGLLPLCKKNNNNNPPPPDVDSTMRLEPGRYIIRSRFICQDGGGFILRSSSNYETIAWEPTSPENLPWQKEADEYIWTVQEIEAVANNPSTPGALVRVGYRLYQPVPGGGYRMLAMFRPATNPENSDEHGSGPVESLEYFAVTELPDSLIGPKTPEFIEANPGYFDGASTTFSIISPTDSTYRVFNDGLPFSFHGRGWNDWIMSLTTKPDGKSCDDYRIKPVMRKKLRSGLHFLPDPNRPHYIPDVCYVTQLVFEKVE